METPTVAPFIPLSLAVKIASYHPPDEQHPEITIAEAEHRIRVVNSWGIRSGDRILEIGCGLGEYTAILAEAVGPTGHVDALDAVPERVGTSPDLDPSPIRDRLDASAIGGRIKWYRGHTWSKAAVTLRGPWDAVVLPHSIWRLDDHMTFTDVLQDSWKYRIPKMFVVEYAMKATESTAFPHVLAAMTRANTMYLRREEDYTVPGTHRITRFLHGPPQIKKTMGENGWRMERETCIVPCRELRDGYKEAQGVVFPQDRDRFPSFDGMKTIVRSGRDAVVAAAEAGEGLESVTTMDIWSAVFVRMEDEPDWHATENY